MRLFSWLAARWEWEGATMRRRERMDLLEKLLRARELVGSIRVVSEGGDDMSMPDMAREVEEILLEVIMDVSDTGLKA